MPKILATIILYHPDENALGTLVRSLLKQGVSVALIDNAEISEACLAQIQKESATKYINVGGNIGIAAAQNIGIDIGLKEDFDFIVLFDQDSKISDDLISNLLKTYEALVKQGVRVAAVGPSFYDSRYRSNFSKNWNLTTVTRKKGAIIASGMLIPQAVLREVGAMDDSLFIDLVDTEWCYRASKKGFSVFQANQAVMDHSIGEAIPVFFGLLTLEYSSPIRSYYYFRNFIYLAKMRRLPKKRIIKGILKDLPMRFFTALFFKTRKSACINIYRGIIDGFKL